jgi:hypothetical protein
VNKGGRWLSLPSPKLGVTNTHWAINTLNYLKVVNLYSKLNYVSELMLQWLNAMGTSRMERNVVLLESINIMANITVQNI